MDLFCKIINAKFYNIDLLCKIIKYKDILYIKIKINIYNINIYFIK